MCVSVKRLSCKNHKAEIISNTKGGGEVHRKTTKEILAESFLELTEKKPIDKITITNITDNCGMSQPTFYNHFKDKYDLIVWIYVTAGQKVMDKIGENGYQWRDTLADGAEYFLINRDFAINALTNTSGQNSFMMYVSKSNVDLLVTEVRKKIMTEQIPKIIMGMIKVYCYGTVQFIFEWIVEDVHLPKETVVEIFEKSLPEPLKMYLYD